MHDDVTVALAVIEVAVVGHVTVKPAAGVTTEVRLIVPAKLKVLVRVTVIAEPVAPLLKFTDELAATVNWPTWTVELAE